MQNEQSARSDIVVILSLHEIIIIQLTLNQTSMSYLSYDEVEIYVRVREA